MARIGHANNTKKIRNDGLSLPQGTGVMERVSEYLRIDVCIVQDESESMGPRLVSNLDDTANAKKWRIASQHVIQKDQSPGWGRVNDLTSGKGKMRDYSALPCHDGSAHDEQGEEGDNLLRDVQHLSHGRAPGVG